MEEPIEREEEVPEAKDSIKSEPASAAGGQGDRGGAGSPTPECSICLGHLINTSFTDSCLHQFCFTCLLQWSKIKTECPLCKQTFKSIIHNVRSEEDYDQYHVPRELVQPPPVSPLGHINLELDFEFMRHIFRRTMTPNRRYRLLPNPGQAQAQTLGDLVPSVSREELRYRRRNPTDFRRNVYRHGEWSAQLPGVYARALERSAEFFRSNPYELNRLIPWMNRDLQILLNGNEPHIAYVLRTIIDALSRYDLRSPELRDILRPYFTIHTDHFLHELMNYARTGFDMAAYDSFITYRSHGLPSGYLNNAPSPPGTTSSSSSSSSLSDDSDVRVVNHVGVDNPPAVGPHALDMPGPSTVSQALQIRIPPLSPAILTISSNSSESDCEVVGYVKPRHERTPEIIEIPSSDGEAPGPSTSTNLVTSPVPPPPPPRSPSFTPPPMEEPSTSQELMRRNHRSARRKPSISQINLSLNSSFNDSSDSESESSDWSKRIRRKRPKKQSKTCRKTSKKSSQRKELQTIRKRSRKTSSSNENDSHHEMRKRKLIKRAQKNRRISDSRTDDTENEPRQNSLIIKIRKDLIDSNERHTEDSSSSSLTSSSSKSSSSESESDGSESDTNLPLKKRKSRRRNENFDEKNRKSRSKYKSAAAKGPAVDSTLLKKDATKKGWYIERKDRSDSGSRLNDDTDRNDTRLRISLSEYRERRAAEQSSEFSLNDEDVKRSSSQCSSRSERIEGEKHKHNRHKGKHKRDPEQPGTSGEKHSENKNLKKHHKSHKKYKSSEAKHSKGKAKRDKRYYSSSSSLSLV